MKRCSIRFVIVGLVALSGLLAFGLQGVRSQEAANFYQMLGQRERAIEILEKALEQSGNSVFRMALAERMRRFGEAEEQERLLRAEAEERPSTTSWFTLANFYVGATNSTRLSRPLITRSR